MPELLCFVALDDDDDAWFSSLRRFDAGSPSFSGERFDPMVKADR